MTSRRDGGGLKKESRAVTKVGENLSKKVDGNEDDREKLRGIRGNSYGRLWEE